MASATPTRQESARELSDDEVMALNDLEAADDEEMELERAFGLTTSRGLAPGVRRGQINDESTRIYRPGERIMDLGDGTQIGRFDATMQGSDPSLVIIYGRDGRPMPMTLDLAKVRLRKRFPAQHRYFPGERVFFMKPPVEFPRPTLTCPGLTLEGLPCPKRFQKVRQQEAHFRNRHKDQWESEERDRVRGREERSISLQEAQLKQTEAMTGILSRLAAGDQVEAREAAAAIAGAGEVASVQTEEQEYPDGVPSAEWTREQIRAFCLVSGWEPEENTFTWKKERWLEFVDRKMNGA